MNNSQHRHGNFSSSEIYKLMTNDPKGNPGKPAKTYLQEKIYEARLGRPLSNDGDTKATIWGKFVEGYVHELLPLSYNLCSQERLFHPSIERWTGAPDMIKGATVVDIKCPQLKSFCELCEINDGEVLKAEYPEYYWQLVSNAIITGRHKAELIVFAPYQSQLDEIRRMAFAAEALEWGNKLYFIQYGEDSELTYINDGGYYSNLNFINFAISDEDKQALTARVTWAVTELNNAINN